MKNSNCQLSQLLCTSFLLWCSINLSAKVTSEQASHLDQELTPFGAQSAGDGGNIPAWQDVAQIDPNEAPLFTITHSNFQQHA